MHFVHVPYMTWYEEIKYSYSLSVNMVLVVCEAPNCRLYRCLSIRLLGTNVNATWFRISKFKCIWICRLQNVCHLVHLAGRLRARSHYLNQCWLIISNVFQHSPESTKPLPEPMLTNHHWCLLTFTWGQFHGKCSRYLPLLILLWKLLI